MLADIVPAIVTDETSTKVVIQSRGGDPEGALQTTNRGVKYLHVAPTEPTLTKVVDEAHEGSAETTSGYDEQENQQTTTNDVKPELEVPKL